VFFCSSFSCSTQRRRLSIKCGMVLRWRCWRPPMSSSLRIGSSGFFRLPWFSSPLSFRPWDCNHFFLSPVDWGGEQV